MGCDFGKLKRELLDLIGAVNPKIEHIGSTSIKGLSAKHIRDILVGVDSEMVLEEAIIPLARNGYIYYECFNKQMPYRRFFVKHKTGFKTSSIPTIITDNDNVPVSTGEHHYRLAHIHILPHDSEHWIRHIASRDDLKTHALVKEQYQLLKEQLNHNDWRDGSAYNEPKNNFIKSEEAKAMRWYGQR